MSWLPVKAVVGRELTKLFRQKARLFSSMVRPMIWLLVIGSGVGSMLSGAQQEGYLQFLVPGVLAMTLLFAALLSALTLVYDKEFGVMRMMMIAPVAHYWIVLFTDCPIINSTCFTNSSGLCVNGRFDCSIFQNIG